MTAKPRSRCEFRTPIFLGALAWAFASAPDTAQLIALPVGKIASPRDDSVNLMRHNESNAIGASLELADAYGKNASAGGGPSGLLSPATAHEGYYYKILRRPASAASTQSDIDNDIAVIAYPASYGVSGLLTFVVDRDGTIYEKDLGPQTVLAVLDLKLADRTWQRAAQPGGELVSLP